MAESRRFSPNGSGGVGGEQKGIRHDEVKFCQLLAARKNVASNVVVIKAWPPFVRSSRGSYETTDSLHLLVRKI